MQKYKPFYMLFMMGAFFIIIGNLLKVMQIIDIAILNWTGILLEMAAIIYFISIKLKEKRQQEKAF